PHDIPYIIELIKHANNIQIEGIMSHFSASEIRDEYGLNQIKKFQEIIDLFRKNKIEPKFIHMANSGGIINYPEAHFNMVRLGISLYGSYPDATMKNKVQLRQAMKLTSKIALIREFSEGSFLSYGRTFKTERPSKIAYIPVGYSDGYPRALSNIGVVLINDTRCCIVGRVCMDWILVDITDCPHVRIGDEVILLGYGDKEAITADEIADLEGTIPYEVLCRLSKKIKRCYID
ncbi:MAG: alanine racemase, partial [Syntrophorhabdaceae bacterium]|nr:alanine racemase [Syntrophorhabdaceae bacterium]